MMMRQQTRRALCLWARACGWVGRKAGRRFAASVLCITLGGLSATGAAAEQCRQALALGLDVSGSVDAREYRLQLDGLAAALQHDEIRRLLLAMPSAPVEIAVFEWSGPQDQTLLVPWRRITRDSDIAQIAATLKNTRRRAASVGTALGTAMQTGLSLLMDRRACWILTLDISGDGKRNLGPYPQEVRPRLAQAGITVNALVIGADAPSFGDIRQVEIAELSSYFRAHVLTGEGAFVQIALGFEAYEQAMMQKLKRELQVTALSRAPARPARTPANRSAALQQVARPDLVPDYAAPRGLRPAHFAAQ